MRKHVADRMPHRALVERHLDSADHELASLGQPVQIVPNSRSRGHEFVLPRDFRPSSIPQTNKNKTTTNARGMQLSSRFIPSAGAVMRIFTNQSAATFIFASTKGRKTMSVQKKIARTLSPVVTVLPLVPLLLEIKTSEVHICWARDF